MADVNEFGGPLGAGAMVFGLPVAVILLNLKVTYQPVGFAIVPWLTDLASDVWVWLIVSLWFAGQMMFSVLPFGPLVSGRPLRTGNRLTYRCNGIHAFVCSIALFGIVQYSGYQVAQYLVDKWISFAVVTVFFSIGLSMLLYVKSFWVSDSISGNPIYDFFMGCELNPNVLGIDLKFACELRPGLPNCLGSSGFVSNDFPL